MKKLVLAFSLCTLSISWGQRNMDFMTMILSPVNNEEISVNQTANFSVELMNNGSEDFLATDSLYIYVTVDGMELTFQPGDSDHAIRTGNAIPANGTYDFAFPIVFTNGLEGSHDVCFRIIPVNGGNQITETLPADNTDCVTIIVVSGTAGIAESELSAGVIYPNPAKEMFLLDAIPDNGEVEILAADGRKMKELHAADGKFDVTHLPDGSYFVNYTEQSKTKTARLIIAH